MSAHRLAVGAVVASLFFAAVARPEPNDDVARANALFNAGKVLRDAGQVTDACPLFAASKRISPGVGVTLYLADCYERTGHVASAWEEFRNAEKLAVEHDDKRAATAHDRAHLLEPKLAGLTIAVPAEAAQHAPEILLDGKRVPRGEWNAAMAVDPGDHVVTVSAPGRPPRTLTAHVESGTRDATLHVEEFDVADTGGPGPLTASSTPATAAEPPPVAASSSHAGRRWAGIGLLAAGAVGMGIGTTFLLNKDQPAPASCNPQPNDSRPTTGAAIAFSAGGVALASGIVLFLTGPHESGAAWTVAPLPLTAGGGAVLRTRF